MYKFKFKGCIIFKKTKKKKFSLDLKFTHVNSIPPSCVWSPPVYGACAQTQKQNGGEFQSQASEEPKTARRWSLSGSDRASHLEWAPTPTACPSRYMGGCGHFRLQEGWSRKWAGARESGLETSWPY